MLLEGHIQAVGAPAMRFMTRFFSDSPDSYGNAVPGCFHAGAGAGPACMNDLVVKSQAINIIGLILSLIRRKTSSTTSRRPRKSSFELLSLSEGHWFTT